MIDHVSFGVSDLTRSRAFYDAVLAPFGATRLMDFNTAGESASGYGNGNEPVFWIGVRGSGAKPQPSGGLHVAFHAASRAQVDAFYKAAIAAGGRDNGPPGLRPHYHPNYYAAFIFDPDGYHIEAVCHHAE